MMNVYTGIPLLYCVGCHQCVCNSPCLATLRARYICHNPSCPFHAPCPAPATAIEQGPTQAGAPPPTAVPETTAIALPAPVMNEPELEPSSASALEDANVICREFIAREWRQVGPGPNTTSEPAASATARTTSAEGTTASDSNVDQSSVSPARFSIEEYQAQAQLLAQYQPRQDRQQHSGQRGGRARRNSSSERGPRRVTRVRFLLE